MSPEASFALSLERVYAKTDAGRAEVGLRAAGLSGRARTLLIMVDGRKPAAALAGVVPLGQLEALLGGLLDRGLIAPADVASLFAPDPVPQAAHEAAHEAAPALPAWLVEIKRDMTDTAETYLGLMAAEVVRRIERAGDEAQLNSVLGHWHMAMRDSKRGRDVAEACLARIQARLRAGAALTG